MLNLVISLKKIKNFSRRIGMDYRNFLKKIFRKGNPILSSGVLGGWYTHTPLHYNDNTLGRLGRLRSVCCLLMKIPLFAFLRYFLRAYVLL